MRVPYTLALVIAGLIVSPMHFLPSVHISPDQILLIFLPALLFEAAWNLRVDRLRDNLFPILILATAGVVLPAGTVAAILHFGIEMSWSSALLFGSIISATDPASVLAIFRKLGAPSRLTAIIEAESLANDGTAVVLFRIILGIVTGAAATQSAAGMILGSLQEFGVVVFGGIAVGAMVGFAASTLTSYFDDHLLEITLTTITAYGAFLLAESIRFARNRGAYCRVDPWELRTRAGHVADHAGCRQLVLGKCGHCRELTGLSADWPGDNFLR